jgi:hypothetical protein
MCKRDAPDRVGLIHHQFVDQYANLNPTSSRLMLTVRFAA